MGPADWFAGTVRIVPLFAAEGGPRGRRRRHGRPTPWRAFDRVTDLDGVPDGHRAMDDREAIKVVIAF